MRQLTRRKRCGKRKVRMWVLVPLNTKCPERLRIAGDLSTETLLRVKRQSPRPYCLGKRQTKPISPVCYTSPGHPRRNLFAGPTQMRVE